jgi:hypothetical protein
VRFLTALALATGCGFSPSAPSDAAIVKPSDAPDAFVPDALPVDLVAWYPMDDLSLHDATNHGHDGACVACPTPADGVIDQALAFAAARIDVPGAGELEAPEGTLAAWLALDATTVGYACPFGTIFNPPSNGNTWQLCLYQASSWQVFLQTTNGTTYFTAPAEITPGAWQHVAIVWTTSKVELFIGGVSKSSLATSALLFDGSIVTIGADRNFPDTIDSPLIGKVDDVRLYSRALSQPELAALAVH